MIELDQIFAGISGTRLLDFDVNPSGVTALLTEDSSGICTALIAGQPWFSWERRTSPHAKRIRWLGDNRIALWSFADRENQNGVMLVSNSNLIRLPLGTPSGIFSGGQIIFACYGEDQNLLAEPSEIESNLVVAFSLDGDFIFGLGEKLRTAEWPGTPIDVSAACATEQNQLLFALYSCDDLWLMDPFVKSLKQIRFPVDVREISALSVTGEKIFFVTKGKSELRFMSVDKSNNELRELGVIPHEVLFGGDVPEDKRPNHVRIHGAMRGVILILAANQAWSVKLPS
jgi:hypothetical protein